MVDAADVEPRSVRRHHPASAAGRPTSSVSVLTPGPPAGATGYSLDRKLVRRELLTWAKKIPVVVGMSILASQHFTRKCLVVFTAGAGGSGVSSIQKVGRYLGQRECGGGKDSRYIMSSFTVVNLHHL